MIIERSVIIVITEKKVPFQCYYNKRKLVFRSKIIPYIESNEAIKH